MSGDSAFDRWRHGRGSVSDAVRRGFGLFTDTFHNLGIGWNPDTRDDRLRRRDPIGLTPSEINDLVELLVSLEGTGWQDEGPLMFPR
jgi:hypothetical protein